MVASSSPAEKAGVQVGDILVSVNGKAATSFSKQCAHVSIQYLFDSYALCVRMLSIRLSGSDLEDLQAFSL